MPRITDDQRYEILVDFTTGKRTRNEIHEAYNITDPTLCKITDSMKESYWENENVDKMKKKVSELIAEDMDVAIIADELDRPMWETLGFIRCYGLDGKPPFQFKKGGVRTRKTSTVTESKPVEEPKVRENFIHKYGDSDKPAPTVAVKAQIKVTLHDRFLQLKDNKVISELMNESFFNSAAMVHMWNVLLDNGFTYIGELRNEESVKEKLKNVLTGTDRQMFMAMTQIRFGDEYGTAPVRLVSEDSEMATAFSLLKDEVPLESIPERPQFTRPEVISLFNTMIQAGAKTVGQIKNGTYCQNVIVPKLNDEQIKLLRIITGRKFRKVEETKVEEPKVEETTITVEEPKVEEPKIEEPNVTVEVAVTTASEEVVQQSKFVQMEAAIAPYILKFVLTKYDVPEKKKISGECSTVLAKYSNGRVPASESDILLLAISALTAMWGDKSKVADVCIIMRTFCTAQAEAQYMNDTLAGIVPSHVEFTMLPRIGIIICAEGGRCLYK